MDICKNYEKNLKASKKHDQQHLFFFWDQLQDPEKVGLLEQIENLDFSRIDKWVENYVKKPTQTSVQAEILPAPAYPYRSTDADLTGKYAEAKKMGEKLISDGKVAAFVVAGGQGTRLGFDGPKGNFRISPVKNKTLFQIFAETIAAASAKYQTELAWYIMTSPLNHSETLDIFGANDYYGLDENNVFIFQQGTMPNFSFDGKILMSDKANLACSPDGHGGSLKALYKSGAIDDMKKRGVEIISYFQIDNPLVNIFDPLFIGLHATDHAQMSSKAVAKTDPTERVGNFCLVDDKIKVIEYSDLSDELAESRSPDGALMFQHASIAIHIINTDFVEKLNAAGFALPLHRAVKKIPHIDDKGQLLSPSKPNGIKLETFVFDALPLASNSIIFLTDRSEEFAPLKNATGSDSPAVSRQMMTSRVAGWLEAAGVKVPRKADGSLDCIIEIAPSFALTEEDLVSRKDRIPPIEPGSSIYLD